MWNELRCGLTFKQHLAFTFARHAVGWSPTNSRARYSVRCRSSLSTRKCALRTRWNDPATPSTTYSSTQWRSNNLPVAII